MGLSAAERRAVTKKMAERYPRATKKQKRMMLDELCALTGWSRDHARRALRRARNPGPSPPRRPPRRGTVYGEDLRAPLVKVWATLGGICGKRLALNRRERR